MALPLLVFVCSWASSTLFLLPAEPKDSLQKHLWPSPSTPEAPRGGRACQLLCPHTIPNLSQLRCTHLSLSALSPISGLTPRRAPNSSPCSKS